GFSDRFLHRADLIADAAAQARKILGPSARLCVVGDTPRDIEAARANALSVLAVATGRFSQQELLAHSPDLCVESFTHLTLEKQAEA
ncbi:MAG TPA: HAD hydrolase-like protein, partial [Terracidiphilus sp.]|nr:HAD hydrolase-like protein [Terracidiphilus sp.]